MVFSSWSRFLLSGLGRTGLTHFNIIIIFSLASMVAHGLF